jgi:hypothetical protein
MKFSATTLLLFSAATWSVTSEHAPGLEYDSHNLRGRKLQDDMEDLVSGKKGDMDAGNMEGLESGTKEDMTGGNMEELDVDNMEVMDLGNMKVMNGGKKGDMNGGKKGDFDCTDDAMPITSCFFQITKSGRYVLTRNLNCGGVRFGIAILADDVHLDCKGNEIRGNGLPPNVFGIGVSRSNHVTVSNCKASQFKFGLRADTTFGPWSDLVVRESTFSNNVELGMSLNGDSTFPGNINVVDSTANKNGNGEPMAGAGIAAIYVEGTVTRTILNDNIGPQGVGFFAINSTEITLIDVIANGNTNAGVFAFTSTVNVINSIACGNDIQDIFGVTTAQANTCDLSVPPQANGFSVCQCPCKGKGAAGAGVSVSGGEGGDLSGWSTSPIFTNSGNFTVAAAVNN